MTAKKILIADDHPLFRVALSQAVAKVFPDAEIYEVNSLTEAQKEVQQSGNISLLLLDLHMSDSHGFSGLIMFRHDHPSLPVVVVSASEEAKTIHRAIEYGAAGFIPKSTPLPQISYAIQAIMAGDIWMPEGVEEELQSLDDEEMENAARLASLTPAQMRVLIGLTDGLLNKQIAYNMGVSEATIKAHVTAIFKKLQVNTRTQAVIMAAQLDVEVDQFSDA
ncbi:MAG: DNA-binding response regulator [Kordiimonas sp.]|nr:DNA-binding response regulator [Kordiimonas sp.]|tara:strand:- start:444 stop:1106 length:663 start_codon:yes stop_codon:yes gene_type:complete